MDGRIRLREHQTRGSVAPRGLGGVFFGLIFVAVGAGICYFASSGVGRKNAPDEVIWAAGGSFSLAGLIVAGHAIRGMIARSRSLNLTDPALVDYPWIRSHTTDSSFGRAAKAFGAALMFAVFLVPFNWWAFGSDDGGGFVALIVGLFDLVLLALLWTAIHTLLQALKYGTSTLRFRSFPFCLGESIRVDFECPQRIEGAQGIEATLRCIDEVVEITRTNRRHTKEIAAYRVHEVRAMVQPEKSSVGTRAFLELPLPTGDFETQLRRNPPRYWELELKSETPGVDFLARFLIPVYQKRG